MERRQRAVPVCVDGETEVGDVLTRRKGVRLSEVFDDDIVGVVADFLLLVDEVEASRQFGGNMLCIGGATSIATEKHFCTIAVGGNYHRLEFVDSLYKLLVFKYALLCGDAFAYYFFYIIH